MNPTKKKGVSFGPAGDVQEEIHFIKSFNEYTPEERKQLWFSRQEFDDISRSVLTLIELMRTTTMMPLDGSADCTRGLEIRTRAGAKRRKEVLRNGLTSVLQEQYRQRQARICEPETLAILYRQHGAYQSQQAATNMGRRDAQEIADYLFEDLPAEFLATLSTATILNRSSLSRSSAKLPSPPLSGGRRNLGLVGGGTSQQSRQVPVRGGSGTGYQRRAAAA